MVFLHNSDVNDIAHSFILHVAEVVVQYTESSSSNHWLQVTIIKLMSFDIIFCRKIAILMFNVFI